jgi:hypothetical protein
MFLKSIHPFLLIAFEWAFNQQKMITSMKKRNNALSRQNNNSEIFADKNKGF